jgi:hypothetical protein
LYQLYHKKEEGIILISPFKLGFTEKIRNLKECKVCWYNEDYYICKDRKILTDFADNLKSRWIERAEKELLMLKEMKIKNKYK